MRLSARQLQEYHLLFAVQAEERGDLPPPPPDEVDEDESDPDEPPADDVNAMVQAEIARVAALNKGTEPT